MDPAAGKTQSNSDGVPEMAWSSATPAEDVVEWIVTFKPASGIIAKIEKFHPETGERHELSLEEYGALATLGAPVMAPGVPASADASAATDMAQVYYQAYYKGVYDYAMYLAGLYYQYQLGANGVGVSPTEDPIEAQRLRLANYAAAYAPPGAAP